MKHLLAIFLIGVSCFLLACGDDAIKHNNLGYTYLQQGKFNEAIAEYQKSIRINPNHAETHYNLARAYSLKGKKPLFIESLQKAISLDRRAIETAKMDSDFDNIRESSEFQKLINPVE